MSLAPVTVFCQDTLDDNFMQAYIVIADTSPAYSVLHGKMLDLATELQLSIDTLGRGYDKAKDLICLPEDDEDEVYAGAYFPRRNPSKALSLEYFDYYNTDGPKPRSGMIALVVEITDKKEEADRTLSKVKAHMSGAYILQASVYMGCMH